MPVIHRQLGVVAHEAAEPTGLRRCREQHEIPAGTVGTEQVGGQPDGGERVVDPRQVLVDALVEVVELDVGTVHEPGRPRRIDVLLEIGERGPHPGQRLRRGRRRPRRRSARPRCAVTRCRCRRAHRRPWPHRGHRTRSTPRPRRGAGRRSGRAGPHPPPARSTDRVLARGALPIRGTSAPPPRSRRSRRAIYAELGARAAAGEFVTGPGGGKAEAGGGGDGEGDEAPGTDPGHSPHELRTGMETGDEQQRGDETGDDSRQSERIAELGADEHVERDAQGQRRAPPVGRGRWCRPTTRGRAPRARGRSAPGRWRARRRHQRRSRPPTTAPWRR